MSIQEEIGLTYNISEIHRAQEFSNITEDQITIEMCTEKHSISATVSWNELRKNFLSQQPYFGLIEGKKYFIPNIDSSVAGGFGFTTKNGSGSIWVTGFTKEGIRMEKKVMIDFFPIQDLHEILIRRGASLI